MNTILGPILRHRITRPAISLLMVALIAGVTGCVSEAGQTAKYSLTIASGEGGSVTTPGEGTFTVDSGRVIDLTATPALGYRFLKWTGSVGTIANVNVASTTITMSGNYSITANFEQTEVTYYTLTVGVTGDGSASPVAGSHTYAAGTVVSISATPSSGYHFVNWTGNVASIANVNAASTTITMNGDYSITANFEQTAITYYALTMASTAGGSISPTVGQHSYAVGTVVPIIATAAAGYYFVNWTGNVGTVANVNAASTTITMNSNYSVAANFAVAMPYALTMAVAGSGSTSPAVGPHTYTTGASVPITASPASGYYFSHWTAPAGSFTNANSATTTFTMPAQDVTVTANFVEGPPFPPGQYTLTMAVTGSGSTSPAVGPHTYAAGASVPITANPAGGYYFSHWASPAGTFGSTTAATTTFTMPAQDVTVTASFAVVPPVQYTLTMTVAGSGSTSPTVGQHTYVGGTSVPIAATPAGGYSFVNWAAPAGTFGSATAAATTFTMPAQSVTVTANFALIPPPQYTLTISSSAGGSITTPGEGVFTRNAGTLVSLVASPGTGYRFANWIGQVGTIADPKAASTTITMNGNYEITAVFAPRFMTSAGIYHTVGLRVVGTVVAVGYNGNGQCNVGGWTNITQVAGGDLYTVGLKSNGTVIAVGDNDHGECNVGGWTNIIQVAAGADHTVGLRADGTVVAVGDDGSGQCDVGSWTNIVQVAVGAYHTVGLRADGTVVAVGYNSQGQCDVTNWTNIIQVSAGLYHTVGLKPNGTVVAAGDNGAGQSNVGGWTNIIQVAAGWLHTVGLRANGTVVAVGYNGYGQCNVGGWISIVQVSAGRQHTVGLRSNGTAAAVGYDGTGQCNVGAWDLN
jgi:methionine-rich copper-binding protein CopC